MAGEKKSVVATLLIKEIIDTRSGNKIVVREDSVSGFVDIESYADGGQRIDCKISLMAGDYLRAVLEAIEIVGLEVESKVGNILP